MNKPHILIMDIETSPLLGYVWGLWEQNVIKVKEEWYILCFAYEWVDEGKTKVVSLPDYKLFKRNKKDDKQVMKKMWKLLDKADIVIAHNGDKFDIRKINARFIINGMNPPSPYKTIDTLKVARSKFAFTSNKLDDLGEYLNVGRKVKHEGFGLWLKCMAGDMKAWKRMQEYNLQDVALLRKVYIKLRPYMTNHPNMNKYMGSLRNCPNCGYDKLIRRGLASEVGNVNFYQRYSCNSCGKWCRGREALKLIKPDIV